MFLSFECSFRSSAPFILKVSFSFSLHISFKSIKKDHEKIPEILPQLKAAKDEYKKITGKDYDQEMKKKEKEAQKLQKATEVKDGAVESTVFGTSKFYPPAPSPSGSEKKQRCS